MTMILNLTQHRATKEQLEAGVVDLDENRFAALKRLLTFEVLHNRALQPCFLFTGRVVLLCLVSWLRIALRGLYSSFFSKEGFAFVKKALLFHAAISLCSL